MKQYLALASYQRRLARLCLRKGEVVAFHTWMGMARKSLNCAKIAKREGRN